MLLSLIIPVYNVEKYLHTCLLRAVALRQNIEIILVDDGSTDTSGALCDEWARKDGRVKVVHQQNGGLSAARNTGIKNSTGEYLMFLDSDDFLDVAETERLLDKLEAKYDAVVGLYQNYYETDDAYERESCQPFLDHVGEMRRDEFLKIIPTDDKSCYLTAWRFVVRRDFLIDNGFFFCEGIYHEDEEWVARWLQKAERLCVTDCWFYQYRQARAGSIMATVKPKHVWDSLLIMEHHKGLLEGAQPKTPYAEFMQARMAGLFVGVLLNYHVLDKGEKKEARKRLRAYYKLCKKGFVGKKRGVVRFLVGVFGIAFSGWVLQTIRKMK